MKVNFGYFAILMSALILTQSANAAPYLAGINDRGFTGSEHYYEIYINCDSGNLCNPWSANANQWVEEFDGNYSNVGTVGNYTNIGKSYDGPSGYSPYVYQINVYAPKGAVLQFNVLWFQDYNGTQKTSGSMPPFRINF